MKAYSSRESQTIKSPCRSRHRLQPSLLFFLSSLFFFLLVVIVLAFQGEAEGTTITVDDDGQGDYRTIQEAVDNASKGDTIRVWDGYYRENVVVNKTLSLIGNSSTETLVDAGGSGSPVLVTANGCQVEGFNLSGSGTHSNDAGIRVEANHSTLSGLISSYNNGSGIHIRYSSDCNISDSSCLGNDGDGIRISDSSTARIVNCSVSGSRLAGIDILRSPYLTIQDSSCLENRGAGIDVQSSDFSNISGCTSSENREDGMWILESDSSFIRDFNSSDNEGAGISVRFSHFTRISDTTIWENEFHSLSLYSSNHTLVTGSDLEDSGAVGIYLRDSHFTEIDDVHSSGSYDQEVYLRSSNFTNIRDSSFSGNEDDHCMDLLLSYFTNITGCRFFDNEGKDLRLQKSDFTNITGSLFSSRNGSGIWIENSDFTTITECDFLETNVNGQGSRYAVALDESNFTVITNSKITGGGGIWVWEASHNCSAHNNSIFDIVGYYPAVQVFKNDSSFDASYNWWGDASGPYHETKNPNGTGDEISDYVIFEPWIIREPEEEKSRLYGKVSEKGSGKLLEAVTLLIDGEGWQYNITTDQEGRYEISLPGTEVYIIRVKKESYLDLVRNVYLGEDQELRQNFQLRSLATVTVLRGVVEDSGSKQDLQGVNITLSKGNYSVICSTDEDGNYEVELEAGEGSYRLEVRKKGYQDYSTNLSLDGHETNYHNFSMAHTKTRIIFFARGGHDNLPGVKITLTSLDFNFSSINYTNEEAYCIVELDWGGNFSVKAQLEGYEIFEDEVFVEKEGVGYVYVDLQPDPAPHHDPGRLYLHDDDQFSPVTYTQDHEELRIKADYYQGPMTRSNKRWVDAGSWEWETNQEHTLGPEVDFRLWYTTRDEGYSDGPEFRFTLTANGASLGIWTGQQDQAVTSPKLYTVQGYFDAVTIPAGTMLEVKVEYRAFEDCYIYFGNRDYDSGLRVDVEPNFTSVLNDLAVVELQLEDTQLSVGDKFQPIAIFRNSGEEELRDVEISFFRHLKGGISTAGFGGKVTIPAGTNQSHTMEWTPTQGDIGEYDFWFMVDPDNKIQETNESNNILSTTITVVPREEPQRGVKLTAEQTRFNFKTINITTISLKIENTGNCMDSYQLSVKHLESDWELNFGEFWNVTLAPGTSQTFNFTLARTEDAERRSMSFEIRVQSENDVATFDTVTIDVDDGERGGGTDLPGLDSPPFVLGLGAILLVALVAAALGFSEAGRFQFLLFLLPLYTRLTRKDIKNDFNRGRIMGYIEANPGVSYTEIMKTLSLSNGTLAYHLQVLEKEKLLVSRREGLYRVFFPRFHSGDKKEETTYKRFFSTGTAGVKFRPSAIQQRIIAVVEGLPGITQVELAGILGTSKQSLNYHIKKLKRAGVLTVKKTEGKARCFIRENRSES